MFYVANDILKDNYLAEDAVHKAFLKLINHLDKIWETESQKTKSFIVIITKNIAIDMYRKCKKTRLQNSKHYLLKRVLQNLRVSCLYI